MVFLFGTMCSACAERDAHFVRDASFGRDVRLRAWGGTRHITASKASYITVPKGTTSLARQGKHHFTKQMFLLSHTPFAS